MPLPLHGARQAAADEPARPAPAARRRREHHPRRGRPPRRRLRGRLQERRRSPRASTTTRPPGSGSRSSARRPGRDRAHRGGRGGPGTGHGRAADLPHRARRRPGGGRAQGHPGRLRRVELGVAPDLRHRRRGQGGLRERPAAGARPARRPGWVASDAGSGWRAARVVDDDGAIAVTPGRRCSGTTWSRTPSSGGTGRRTRSTRRPGRASRTCSTPSRRTARSSTWTSSSGWSRWSSSPAPRTSAGR